MSETPNSNPETREPDQKSESLSAPENLESILEKQEEQEKKECVEVIKAWVKKTVQEWHDKVSPDYIFVTETASVPYGYVLKETWKNTYPDEDCPDFYRIDPTAIPEPGNDQWVDEKTKEIIKQYFSKRIRKDDAKIIVFDEGGPKTEPINLDKVEQYINGEGGLIVSGRSLRKTIVGIHYAYKKYVNKKEGEIWASGDINKMSSGATRFIYGNDDESSEKNISVRPTSKIGGDRNPHRAYSDDEKLIKSDNKIRRGEYNLTGNIVKHPEQRKRAVAFVKELRKIGKQAGEELYTELEINN